MGKTRTLANTVSAGGPLVDGGATASGAAVTTSGAASYSFSSLPTWVKTIKLVLRNVSTSDNAGIQLKFGTAGGLVTSGYTGTILTVDGSTASSTGALSDAFIVTTIGPTLLFSGVIELNEIAPNIWVHRSHLGAGGTRSHLSVGELSVGAELTTVQISVGVGTFDGGTINVLYS